MKNRPDQGVLIASNPAVAAQFFNIYIKAFIEALGYDPKHADTEGGLLGVVSAYYGVVEAQGRGTLHCHMLIWLEGSLNPDEIKAKALRDGGDLEFQQRLMAFLEDAISTSVPPEADPGLDVPLSKYHPCATRGPPPSVPASDMENARANDLSRLAHLCQYHIHTRTCYKYWKGPGHPKECRFDLDASHVRPVSIFDPETGEFELRCLDGLVNHFNETMLESLRCDMDIKFVSSGKLAKAAMFYITDYITKTQLQSHVAYAALELAAMKLSDFNPDQDEFSLRARRLLQKCAYAMIAQQELSGQQVVSYLMGYEDHFTSHKYVNLYWTPLEGFINSERPSPECYSTHRSDTAVESGTAAAVDAGDRPFDTTMNSVKDVELDDITLTVGPDGKFKATANQSADYQHRG
ncbi:hypothetical protein B0H16DRAFT_1344231, partial [Mycena metata]